MQILRIALTAAVALTQTSAGNRTDPLLAAGAASGHAIVISGSGRVALLGIRAPAAARGAAADPMAVEARERLNGLVAHRFVILEYPHDVRAGSVPRGAAYVFLEDGTFVNRLLVREGLARVSGARSAPRAQELQNAEAAARAERRGIWRESREPELRAADVRTRRVVQLQIRAPR